MLTGWVLGSVRCVFACNFALRRANANLTLFEEDRQYAAVEDWMFLLQNMQQDTVYLKPSWPNENRISLPASLCWSVTAT